MRAKVMGMAFRLIVMASVAVALQSLVVGSSVTTAAVRAMVTLVGLSLLVALANRASLPPGPTEADAHKGKLVDMVAGDD